MPWPLAKARTASIMRSAASRCGQVAVSAISQCGSVNADWRSPIRASALSASSLPAVADVDAEALEAKQNRRCVLHVDVDVRRGRP